MIYNQSPQFLSECFSLAPFRSPHVWKPLLYTTKKTFVTRFMFRKFWFHVDRGLFLLAKQDAFFFIYIMDRYQIKTQKMV